MNIKMEKLEKNIIKLEITVEAERFNKSLKKSSAKNSKSMNIPGFRKGKAPMNIIKKMYGENVFFEDAINFCCDDTYPEALKEHDINPLDYPKIDIIQIGEGKEFIYTASVEVAPEVKLGEYKGLEAKKVEYNVSDDEIESQLKGMQEKNARIEDKIDGTVAMGDIAIIDFKGFIEETAFEGGEGKDFELEIGSGSFIDTFEEQLVGLKAGDAKEVKVNFPEAYGREDLNGKQAIFNVTVKSMKAKELPAIDDEFAKEISEFDTLEELRNDIKNALEKSGKDREKKEFEEAVIDAACANVEMDIPEIMVKRETDVMLKDLEMKLKQQGLDLESYYQYTNNTEEKVRAFMKESAEKRVKTDLVITEIAKKEKVEASDEEMLAKAKEVAKQYGEKDIDKTADLIMKAQKQYLKIDVLNEKVIKMLVDNAKVIA
ncbi:trigger factor [Clostridium estertheticum]|uniref:trigger factor n=1 Tax=Clostridium estertheticum TaxID=238834 RepID=UPI001C0AAAF2|nr:trigger factor [Clostridium estertheticum]MBU3213854.1 trigger factor [Clostridium estertheticum]WAG53734.1 trigger factor [Clostridium estertheticum]